MAQRQVHAVAVVVWKRHGALVEHADEAGIAALVGALRLTAVVGRRDEEHVHALDELAILVANDVTHDRLVEAVGQETRVEAVLQLVRAVVLALAHPPSMQQSMALTTRAAGPVADASALVSGA